MSEKQDSMARAGDEFRLRLGSEDETRRFGAALSKVLEPGDLVALVGPLGAGKTCLVQALAGGLGAEPAAVNSPTFVLIQEYEGRVPIYHFDAYRLKDLDEFLALGVDEVFDSGGVCLVEWADRVLSALPTDHLRVELAIVSETARDVTVRGSGTRSTAAVERLRALLE